MKHLLLLIAALGVLACSSDNPYESPDDAPVYYYEIKNVYKDAVMYISKVPYEGYGYNESFIGVAELSEVTLNVYWSFFDKPSIPAFDPLELTGMKKDVLNKFEITPYNFEYDID